ncbi:hypothetical protein [Aliamphritea hakodatensis]|uniref:hypothetical protein n=1 Tax=Aliamphritea hakodatensis TaxID=2895352 RepID=UPI0022FD41F0|nr:hypothetical protein [Aliamphritea hakodatensis]
MELGKDGQVIHLKTVNRAEELIDQWVDIEDMTNPVEKLAAASIWRMRVRDYARLKRADSA